MKKKSCNDVSFVRFLCLRFKGGLEVFYDFSPSQLASLSFGDSMLLITCVDTSDGSSPVLSRSWMLSDICRFSVTYYD